MDQKTRLGLAEGGVLSSRSVMLPELAALLAVAPPAADTATLQRLAMEEDALHKPSAANRVKTFAFLRRLYGLSVQLPAYREFTRLCHLSPADTQVLAGTLAFAREPVLRACCDMVLAVPMGNPLRREDFEAWVREHAPGRYSQAMYVSFSHNLYASFFQLGFLSEAAGKARIRTRRDVRPVSVAYAAFLDWLTGLNGLSLLSGALSRTLELSKDEHLSLLSAAGQQGLMRVAHAGGVLQLDFSAWLQPGEIRLTVQ
ncbi:MAG: hypothetical protein QUV35_08090 [Hydrogenophaga sp.]|uniref:hypothetical protein n=1 Tax=Hydrogenophaga sp. TaxID=1904254 RepID=UPI002619DED7|nr:hypothetical protein [Hydrogenophaga sp.]MDM7942574.1 hypothetical protein [Hydrogenophaga sp.]